jgi:hypothetical protein
MLLTYVQDASGLNFGRVGGCQEISSGLPNRLKWITNQQTIQNLSYSTPHSTSLTSENRITSLTSNEWVDTEQITPHKLGLTLKVFYIGNFVNETSENSPYKIRTNSINRTVVRALATLQRDED